MNEEIENHLLKQRAKLCIIGDDGQLYEILKMNATTKCKDGGYDVECEVKPFKTAK